MDRNSLLNGDFTPAVNANETPQGVIRDGACEIPTPASFAVIPANPLWRMLGTPDACTKCHSDRSQEWSAEAWAKWYGPSPRTDELRTRARAVARAHRSDISVVPDLLDLIPGEKVSAWRASLPTLAARLAPEDARVLAEARSLSTDADPLVRSAAVRALAVSSGDVPRVREALADPVRLVRLDAALALSTELDPATTARAEHEAYLAATIEGPVARLRRGQERFQRGERDAGIADVRKAIELDPLSPAMPETLGMMLNAAGDSQSAAQQFERVANLAPSDAGAPYFAALAWAEAGDLKRAEAMFGETVRRDPRQSRAWYNLGLLLSQTGRIDDALRALRQAQHQLSRALPKCISWKSNKWHFFTGIMSTIYEHSTNPRTYHTCPPVHCQ
jgi:hypothetical protein